VEEGSEMRSWRFFLTGVPGSGKSTAFMRCVERFRMLGFTVGGISTPEIRSRGRRVGFSVIDLASGRRALLAGVDLTSGFRVGRYGVDVSGFESVALPALDYAEESCDAVCVDEIGRMELFSKGFKRRVEELMSGPKPMVAVLHRDYIKVYGRFGTLLSVTPKNRDGLPELVVSGLIGYLKRKN
jgi:nucleoside-triphosphatase